MNIASRVSYRLLNLNMTQVELAQAIGMSKSTLNYILNNQKQFPADYIVPLAEKLNVSVSWLLTGVENPSIDPYVIMESPGKLAEDEQELLEIYRSLDREGKTSVLYAAYSHRGRVKAALKQKKTDSPSGQTA